jgi:hypothetical protein
MSGLQRRGVVWVDTGSPPLGGRFGHCVPREARRGNHILADVVLAQIAPDPQEGEL